MPAAGAQTQKAAHDDPHFPEAPGGTESRIDPLARLAGDHQRQRAACDVLERLIRNPRHSASGADIEQTFWCLGEALPMHIADEEDDFLPLLARRCALGDRFAEISATLRSNHDSERALAESVAGELQRLIDGGALFRPVRFFSDTIRLYRLIRRHIGWEDTVLIPLARRRLRDLDYPYLMEKMEQRRRPRPPRRSSDLG